MAKRLTGKPRDEKHLDILYQVAQTSTQRAKLAAAIVIDNRIVSIGMNSFKTHPMQARFGKNALAICIHAEIDAISKALRKVSAKELSRATLYVARAKRDGTGGDFVQGLAKPCSGCAAAMASFNIKRVFFTEDAKPN